MRYGPVAMTALILGGFVVLSAPASAASLPTQPARAFGTIPVTVETVAYWRRYCRFHDRTGPEVIVAPQVVVPPAVTTLNPPVAIVPVRPVSCGEFHYWNGVACVDARYNDPYLGPR